MPPGIGYGDGATGILEGLVGGFLMGHNFRTQRDDRKRRLAQEQQAAMQAAEDRRLAMEDRARGRAVEDYSLRTEHGVAFSPETGGMVSVGPSAAQRESNRLASIRKGVGSFLAASPEERTGMFRDPNVVAGLGDMGFDIDAYIENSVPKATNAVNWSTQNTSGGLIQVNPETGEVRPVMREGQQVVAPSSAGGRPTEVQTRLSQVLPRAESSFETIERLVEAFGGTVPASTLLRRAGIGGQYATDEQEQVFNQAAEALATALLRAESGAAISRDEQRSYREQFIPSPGDKPPVVRQKLNTLRATLEEMRRLATVGPVQAEAQLSPDNPYQ